MSIDLADIKYYQAYIHNKESYSIPVLYNENRTVPLIDRPGDFYVSVVRFNIDAKLVPIFLAQAQNFNVSGNTGPNNLIYSVGLSYGGTGAQAFLQWNPNTIGAVPLVPVFNSETPGQIQTDPYYYENSYLHFISIVNQGFATAFASMPSVPAGVSGAPYITMDSGSHLCTLWCQAAYFNSQPITNPNNLVVWMNTPLHSFFPNWSWYFNSWSALNGQNWGLLPQNFGNNVWTLPSQPIGISGATGSYYAMVEEYSSLIMWEALQCIRIRSNLPTYTEANTGSDPMLLSMQGSSSSNAVPTLTDFVPYNDHVGSFRETFQYNPTGQFRLIDMTSASAINNVNYSVDIVLKNGVALPLYMYPGETFEVKTAFFKKLGWLSRIMSILK